MAANPPQPKGRDHAIPALDALIQILEVAKVACVFPPAQVAIGSTSALLMIIKDSVANKQDFVELGKSCGNVCQALDRGLNGKRSDELSRSVLEAIGQLTETVAEIQRRIVARGKRNLISRTFHARNDKDAIVTWGRSLDRILNIFNTELLLNNHTILLDIRNNALADKEATDGQNQSTQARIPPGELPPPPPRACFGRDELIKKIVGLAEDLQPIALIGPGGIGKTSVALAVLHNDNIKRRFGDNRRFVRCDQFSASRANFLNRLSNVIGAGVENPEDLTLLRPSLTSKETLIVLDNAESILDPQGTDGQEIYGLVEELCQLDNVCLCITSRLTTIPPDCNRLDVPTLSKDDARSAFYRIYNSSERSGQVDEILKQLDFHPLSVTLLATVARQNEWDTNRLVEEWQGRQTDILKTEHNKSLAATIELSLASHMFRQLGPDAQGLLGVVAFFPQGIDEKNLDWLFPTFPNRKTIFDKFCVLSLAYRSSGFITMLAPLRDYLCPKDPDASPLLSATKGHYLARLSVFVDPGRPGFEEARWITSEDVNVEHLLDIFSSTDPNSEDIWDSCNYFMRHLYWFKPRQTVLGAKIEHLPDDHPRKPIGLFRVAEIFEVLGRHEDEKRLFAHSLKLWRERRDSDRWIASTLQRLADTNRMLGLFEEGIQQTQEASEIFERLGDAAEQAECLSRLAYLLLDDKQPIAAEEATIRSIALLGKGDEFKLCGSHRVLGEIYSSQGKREKAIHHINIALGIADSFNWQHQQFWIHELLAKLSRDEGEFDNAHTHIKQAKENAVDDKYYLGRAMETHARIWNEQGRHEEAVSEALGAIEIYGKLGAAMDLDKCTAFLRLIEQSMKKS